MLFHLEVASRLLAGLPERLRLALANKTSSHSLSGTGNPAARFFLCSFLRASSTYRRLMHACLLFLLADAFDTGAAVIYKTAYTFAAALSDPHLGVAIVMTARNLTICERIIVVVIIVAIHRVITLLWIFRLFLFRGVLRTLFMWRAVTSHCFWTVRDCQLGDLGTGTCSILGNNHEA
jgi:hypothetical protein